MKRFQTSIICSLIIVLVVLACFRSRPNESQAQTQNTPVAFDLETLRESIANFFEKMSDNSKGPGRAVDDFLKNSSLAETEKTRTKLAEDIRTINNTFGNYVSYEPIGVKMVGTDLVVFRYLYKCQNYPVVWYFTYYRPRAKSTDASAASASWTLIGFRFDTNLDAALLDATFDQRN